MAQGKNSFLKVWEPTWFVLDYEPARGYCFNISLEVDNPFVRKRFTNDFGSPFRQDIPSSYHKLKDFVDKTLKMYKETLANYEKALARAEEKLKVLGKNPLRHYKDTREGVNYRLLTKDFEDIQASMEIVKGNILLVESMLGELNEIKQEYSINDL